MGQIETFDLGAECSGVVARVGPDVKFVKVGDRVLAQAFGTFSTFAKTREMFVSPIPQGMAVEEAASLPIVYSTALYALRVARLAAGETVLIHCAAGGLGQALVALCRLTGAGAIYVTVGTAAKKAFVMEHLGVPEEHIFSSRDVSFESGVMRATGGRGVDVVFNSLSSELLRATWACIASFGRFIELGKRDFAVNARLDMAKFARNVTFAAVDLAAVIRERPEEAAAVQREAVALLAAGKASPPRPVSVYSIEELQTALRTMQTGRHMGKLVIKPGRSDRVRVSDSWRLIGRMATRLAWRLGCPGHHGRVALLVTDLNISRWLTFFDRFSPKSTLDHPSDPMRATSSSAGLVVSARRGP